MLPDKSKLNNKLIEHINGGNNFIDFSENEIPNETMQYFICKKCYGSYKAYKPSKSGYCPICELTPLKTEISTGNMKTTIPNISDELVKIH